MHSVWAEHGIFFNVKASGTYGYHRRSSDQVLALILQFSSCVLHVHLILWRFLTAIMCLTPVWHAVTFNTSGITMFVFSKVLYHDCVWRTGGVVPCILILSITWRCVWMMLRSLYNRKRIPLYSLDRGGGFFFSPIAGVTPWLTDVSDRTGNKRAMTFNCAVGEWRSGKDVEWKRSDISEGILSCLSARNEGSLL